MCITIGKYLRISCEGKRVCDFQTKGGKIEIRIGWVTIKWYLFTHHHTHGKKNSSPVLIIVFLRNP